jgi:predicted HTH transcriptional regulator
MAEILNVSRDVIKRNIKKLKDSKKITRKGNRNNGSWRIL